MNKKMVLGALAAVAVVAAACGKFGGLLGGGNKGAPDQWANTAFKCTTPKCDVDITVASGAGACAAANPDVIRIVDAGPPPAGRTLHFNLVTNGYHFTPNGITIKNDANNQFSKDNAQSGPKKLVFNDKNNEGRVYHKYDIDVLPDGGGPACHVDPGVINDPSCEGC